MEILFLLLYLYIIFFYILILMVMGMFIQGIVYWTTGFSIYRNFNKISNKLENKINKIIGG